MKHFKLKGFLLVAIFFISFYALYSIWESPDFNKDVYDYKFNANIWNQDIDWTYFDDWTNYNIVTEYIWEFESLSGNEQIESLISFYQENIVEWEMDFNDNKFNRLKFADTSFKLLSWLHSCYVNYDQSIEKNIDYYYNLDIDEKSGGNDFDFLRRYSWDQCNSPVFYDFYKCENLTQESYLNLMMDYRSELINRATLEKKLLEKQKTFTNQDNSLEKTFFSQYFYYSLTWQIVEPSACFRFLRQ